MSFIKKNFVELIIIGLFSVVCFFFYTQNPPPWPDEPFYLTLINNLTTKGYLGTDLYGPAIAGLNRVMFFYPPFYFLILVPFFFIFGPSLELLRFFSIGCSVVGLILVCLILRRLIKNIYVRYAVLFAIAFNNLFMRGARVGRMDPFLLMLVLAVTYFFIRFLEDYKRNKITSKYFVLASVFTGLLGVTHPFAVFIYISIVLTLIIIYAPKSVIKYVSFYTVISLLIFSMWGIYIFINYDAFLAQMGAQLVRKGDMILMIPSAFPVYYLAIPFLAIVFAIFLVMSKRKELKKVEAAFIMLTAILAGILFSFSKEMWYIIFPLVFALITMGIALDYCLDSSKVFWKWFCSPVLLILFVFCISKNVYDLYSAHSFVDKNYKKFCNELGVDTIPEGSKLYFAGIPEPYFLF